MEISLKNLYVDILGLKWLSKAVSGKNFVLQYADRGGAGLYSGGYWVWFLRGKSPGLKVLK